MIKAVKSFWLHCSKLVRIRNVRYSLSWKIYLPCFCIPAHNYFEMVEKIFEFSSFPVMSLGRDLLYLFDNDFLSIVSSQDNDVLYKAIDRDLKISDKDPEYLYLLK